MRRKPVLLIVVAVLLAMVPWYVLITRMTSGSSDRPSGPSAAEVAATADPSVVGRFEYLSTNGNSSCSRDFMNSIASMPADMRLRGSCCGPMTLHRYSEQVAALKKYSSVADIPSDPYDIEAGLATRLMSYDVELTAVEQQAYDFAMANSKEQGPCCCRCWRWEVYGGLAKDLIRNFGFTGEQVTEVWNLSNGCGGDGEHFHGTVTSQKSPPLSLPVAQEVLT